MSATTKTRRKRAVAYCVAAVAAVPAVANAGVPDLVFIHCSNGGGDYRISELNHMVSKFSVRDQQYRPLCATCDIIEWGNRITMKDGTKSYIQIDRMTGDVVIQRFGAAVTPASSYAGTCARGAAVVAKTTRAF
jgi:hypothetical protein